METWPEAIAVRHTGCRVNDGNPPTPQLYDKLDRLRERVAELERIEEARRSSYATRAALDTAEMIDA